MTPLPFDIRLELPGWELFLALLELAPGHDAELATRHDVALAALRREVVRRAAARHQLETLASDPTVAALRILFRSAGCDPTRYRPSSEALLRRLIKGEELPVIHPLVDLNNCLSTELAVPCCVVTEGTMMPPLVLRAGREGESYESLRGPFNLAGKPLLLDAEGPLDTPITGSQRVKVRPDTTRAWLVAYLPRGVVPAETAEKKLEELVAAAPVAKIEQTGSAGG